MATRHPDGRNSIRHGNARPARIARWLDKRPASPRVNQLRLEVRIDGEWSCLQVWETSEAHAALADTIDATIVEYASEQGSFTIARIAWFEAEAEKYWTTYDLRVAPEQVEGAQDMGQSFSGDVQSTNIQTQRHLEFMMRQHVGGTATAMQALRDVAMSASSQLTDAQNDAREARQELQALQAELAATHAKLDEALGQLESLSDKQEQADQQGNVIALITQAVGKGQA